MTGKKRKHCEFCKNVSTCDFINCNVFEKGVAITLMRGDKRQKMIQSCKERYGKPLETAEKANLKASEQR